MHLTLYIIFVVLVVTSIQGCLLGDYGYFFLIMISCQNVPAPLGMIIEPLSCHKLCVHMHVNKKKFERNTSSLEYYMYHMTCFGKTKHTS